MDSAIFGLNGNKTATSDLKVYRKLPTDIIKFCCEPIDNLESVVNIFLTLDRVFLFLRCLDRIPLRMCPYECTQQQQHNVFVGRSNDNLAEFGISRIPADCFVAG